MNVGVHSRPLLLALSTALSTSVQASTGTENLDACLQEALHRHPGIVVEWEVEDGTGRGYRILVIAPDTESWEVDCSPTSGAVLRDQRVPGGQDYRAYTTRAIVTETQARWVVSTYYPGRFIEMEYLLNWRGGATYRYTLVTADDREATIEVNAADGRIARTRSSAR